MSFAAVLETDLRSLSAESRKGEGFAGWLSGGEHPEIKEAAERALLRLRQSRDGVVEPSQDLLRPFLLACGTKSTKLHVLGLTCVQKLVANDAVQKEDVPRIVSMLWTLHELGDDTVLLKALQTVLTVLQSSMHPTDEESTATLLRICFRLGASNRGGGSGGTSAAVLSTAAAAVRQAVTLVLGRLPPPPPVRAAGDPEEPDCPAAAGGTALLLLEDLCLMSWGNPPKWLKELPPIPSSLGLDLLESALSHQANVLVSSPPFAGCLRDHLCPPLMAAVRAAGESTGESPPMKHLYRIAGAVVLHLSPIIPVESSELLALLLGEVAAGRPASHRVQALASLRHLCHDPHLVRLLFERHEMAALPTGGGEAGGGAGSPPHRALAGGLVAAVAAAVEAVAKAPPGGDDLFSQVESVLASRGGLPGGDGAGGLAGGPASDEAQAGALAVESLLGLLGAVEALCDSAEGRGELLSPSLGGGGAATAGSGGGSDLVAVTEHMVAALWRPALAALSPLLSRASREPVVLSLLRGYQAITHACGSLGMTEPRDAFLSSLCHFSLEDGAHPGEHGGGDAGGSGAGTGVGRVLKPKNVQALRTLFNVAHRLSSVLGSSWVVVLRTLDALDRVLASPHTTTQEVSTAPTSGAQADLSILATAADQLFESSARLPDAAASALLDALREVSSEALGGGGGGEGGGGGGAGDTPGGAAPALAAAGDAIAPSRLPAFSRMADTVLHNPRRLELLWPTFSAHIAEVMSSPSKPVRAAAMEVVDNAVAGALAIVHARVQDSAAASSSSGRDGTTSSPPSPLGALEGAVLSPLLSLCGARYAADADTQARALGALHHVLQQHGDLLTAGWGPVLELLEAAAGQGGAKHDDPRCVLEGFRCVSLVVGDYLAGLPAEAGGLGCVRVCAAYARQSLDVNTSLSAVGLLWSAADFLCRPQGEAKPAAWTPGGPSPEAAVRRAEAAAAQARAAAPVLMALLASLAELSTDPRPEVRNSGIRTLISTMVSHGGHLPPAQWQVVLWDHLFPLVARVRRLAAGASQDEHVGTELGKDKGRAVRMLVHHSRNTSEKQWDETLVLCLNGLARLLRAHLPALASLDGFHEGWATIVDFVETSVLQGNKEVALAGSGALHTVLQAHAGGEGLPKVVWEGALAVYGRLGGVAAARDTTMPLQVRQELIASVGELYAERGANFSTQDALMVVGMLDALARSPHSAHDQMPLVPGTIPQVQRTLLEWLPKIVPLRQHAAWAPFLSALLAYPAEAARGLMAAAREGGGGGGGGEDAGGAAAAASAHMSPEFGERMVQIIVDVYREHTPMDVRGAALGEVVGVIAQCVRTRQVARDGELWRTAAAALVSVVRAGLPALNAALDGEYGEEHGCEGHVDDVWVALAGAFESVLLYDGPAIYEEGGGGGASPSEGDGLDRLQTDGELETLALDTLTDVVLATCAHAPAAIRSRLVSIIDCGASHPPPAAAALGESLGVGERFSHTCLRKLFVLSARGGRPGGPHSCTLEVSQLAVPVLLGRCEAALRAYSLAEEAAAASEAPTERGVMEELMCVMEVLSTLDLDPRVSDSIAYDTPPVKALLEARRATLEEGGGGEEEEHGLGRRERAHLLVLWPALAACVPARDARVRGELAGLIATAGAELGLGAPPPACL